MYRQKTTLDTEKHAKECAFRQILHNPCLPRRRLPTTGLPELSTQQACRINQQSLQSRSESTLLSSIRRMSRATFGPCISPSLVLWIRRRVCYPILFGSSCKVSHE